MEDPPFSLSLHQWDLGDKPGTTVLHVTASETKNACEFPGDLVKMQILFNGSGLQKMILLL